MAYKIPSHRLPLRPQTHVLGAIGNGTIIYNKNDYRQMPDGSMGHGTSRTIQKNGQVDLMKSQLMRYLSQEIQRARGADVILIDVGANIGLHTITLAEATYPKGKVFAYEPQPWVYYCLCGNMAINNLHNATAHQMALGNQTGRMKIRVPDPMQPASFGSFGLDPNWNMDVGQTDKDMVETVVQIAKFDDLNHPRVDLIKLDIEGLEAAFIQGAAKSLAAHKPAMIIEYLKGDRAHLIKTLEDNHYAYMRYSAEQDIICWHKEDQIMDKIIHSLLTEERLELGYEAPPASKQIATPSINVSALKGGKPVQVHVDVGTSPSNTDS
ncbi:MAG: FkbM family methyltransferase [Alphaproteobacteria bacterium]